MRILVKILVEWPLAIMAAVLMIVGTILIETLDWCMRKRRPHAS